MIIREITQDDFRKQINSFSECFALFESEIIEEKTYDLKDKDTIDSFKMESLETIVDKIEDGIFPIRVWEDTRLEKFAHKGSLLIPIKRDSLLIDKYLSVKC